MFFYSVYKITKVLFVVSTDHLAVQGGLTDVLRQLAVGFSRPHGILCLPHHRSRPRQLLAPWRHRYTTALHEPHQQRQTSPHRLLPELPAEYKAYSNASFCFLLLLRITQIPMPK